MFIIRLTEKQRQALLDHLDLADDHCEAFGLNATEEELKPLQVAREKLEGAKPELLCPPVKDGSTERSPKWFRGARRVESFTSGHSVKV